MTRRFTGTLVAALLLAAVVLGVRWWEAGQGRATSPSQPPAVFRFDKGEVVGFRVMRDDLDLTVRREHGVWRALGRPWAPSAAVIRRVAHQLHELDARTAPLTTLDDPNRFGLGRATVHVYLRDGREVTFEVGDPTPRGVTYYLRPVPGDEVMVVQRAAVAFAFEPLSAFREDHLAMMDPAEVERVEAQVDGRHLAFDRASGTQWVMTAPVEQPASREQVRRILGRVAALRATAFVDQPRDRAPYGLADRTDYVTVSTGAAALTLWAGRVDDDVEPPRQYVYVAGDDVVAEVRAGWLDTLRRPLDEYRDEVIVKLLAHQVQGLRVTRGDEVVALRRTSDGWRDEHGAFPGRTPERVVKQATGVRATAFDADGHAPTFVVSLSADDGSDVRLRGRRVGEGLVVVDDAESAFEVSPALADAVDDLLREHRRRLRDPDAPVTP